MHLRKAFQTMHAAFLRTFDQSNWIWRVNGIAISEKSYSPRYHYFTEGNFLFFEEKFSK